MGQCVHLITTVGTLHVTLSLSTAPQLGWTHPSDRLAPTYLQSATLTVNAYRN